MINKMDKAYLLYIKDILKIFFNFKFTIKFNKKEFTFPDGRIYNG